MTRIAIIGAGMAGAAAAHRLSASGHRVALFDKGRSIGGRMATRRLPGGLTVDYGAQYFTARDSSFLAAVQDLRNGGSAAAWGESGWSVGTPAMTAAVHAFTSGLDVTSDCNVAKLIRNGEGWRLADATGAAIGGIFNAVLVTAPAPQALALIETTGILWPELPEALRRVRYAPCWALMLAHTGPRRFDETHRRERDPTAPIAWIARDATKPGRNITSETLVAHAAPAWSRAHLEHEPDDIVALLMAELRRAIGSSVRDDADVTYAAAHRWRYAMVEEPVGEPCLWSPDLRIGVAGDGCLGGRVEAAYLSGVALAGRVLATSFPATSARF